MTRVAVARGVFAVGMLIVALPVVSATDVVSGAPVPTDEFIVVSDLSLPATAAAVENTGAETLAVHDLGRSFAVVSASAAEARAIEALPGVDGVYPNRLVSLFDQQTNPPWGIDRIDQRSLPLDARYRYSSRGVGVTAYVVDTGVRSDHVDFSGRVTAGYNAASSDPAGTDCSGHGTHVAGTIGGTYSGVAKSVTLVPVRVFACGATSTPTSTIIAGLAWMIADHDPGEAAVANLSLGATGSDPAFENAVRSVVADGITVVAAAGNETADACGVTPARVSEAITVGATDANDVRASFSNFGTCVDLYAPGVSIVSTSRVGTTLLESRSGTSMAAPHVAGAVALLLEEQPGLTPAQVANTLVGRATPATPGPLLFSAVRFPLSVSFAGAGAGKVESNPGALACTAQCSASFDADASVRLVAMPAQGSRFAGWSGACAGAALTCTVVLADNRSVTASFEPATCASISAAGRLGFWKGSNSTAGVNGPALTGASGYSDAMVGQGFVFDASSALSSSTMPTITGALTVMAWVKPISMASVQTVISRSSGPAMSPDAPFAHGYSLRLTSPRGLEWEVDDPSTLVPEVLVAQTNQTFDDGAWHHIAATWAPGSMEVFVDGVEVARRTSSSGSINPATATAFMVGGEQNSPFNFAGMIDEPAVYGRVLSASEISAAYGAATAGLCS